MNAPDYLRIAPFLHECPRCGYGDVGTNEKTGEYAGAMHVNGNEFIRKCRCGFEITIDADKETSRALIRQKIDSELARFQTNYKE